MSARSAQTIPLGVLLGVAFIAFLSSPLLLRGDTPPSIPPDVAANAAIAQQNMRQIQDAIWRYMADNEEHVPSSPKYLYPKYVSDPQVFWNPGDDTPPPTTIDNDFLDAPNSSQCSFRINLDALKKYYFGGPPCDSLVLIEDLSASNNAGYFRNLITTGGLETAPMGLLAGENPSVVARQNLRQLLVATNIYANDNRQWLPLTADLYVDYCLVFPEEYWHPGDDQPVPRWITNAVVNAPESAQISFTYLGAGLTTDDTPNTPVFRDNSPANNEGFGTFVALLDGHVEYQPLCTGDLNGDLRVDVYDLAPLGAYMSPTGSTLPSEGDANGDGFTNFTDLAIVQQHAGELCAP